MKNLCKLVKSYPGSALFILMAAILWTVPATAGGDPSEETCRDLGKIEIKCLDCATGEYIGSVTVDALYDSSFGDCNGRYKEAREICARAYGRNKFEIGTKWSYSIGLTDFYGNSPPNCKY